MNFLLHRHLAARDVAPGGALARTADGTDSRVDPAIAGIGAMLPDLWAMADRAVRPRIRSAPTDELDAATESLLVGVDHHLRADAWFHRHPVFVDGEKELARELRAAADTTRKMGLFGHIGWELCLDGALVRRNGLDDVLDQLRHGLTAAGDRALQRAVASHHSAFAEPESSTAQAFHERLRGLLASLTAGGWIEGYRHGPGLVARLSGVRRRVGLPPVAAQDASALAAALDRALDRADRRLQALLDEPPQG